MLGMGLGVLEKGRQSGLRTGEQRGRLMVRVAFVEIGLVAPERRGERFALRLQFGAGRHLAPVRGPQQRLHPAPRLPGARRDRSDAVLVAEPASLLEQCRTSRIDESGVAQELRRGVDPAPRLKTLKVVEPPKRKAGVKVKSVAELVDKLRNEAKVI